MRLIRKSVIMEENHYYNNMLFRKLKAQELQKALDEQHRQKEFVNSLLNTNYTTKEALEKYKEMIL